MSIHAMAEIEPKEDDFDEVVSILSELVERSRGEPGNVVYDLFANEDGKTLHIVEVWEDEASLKAHMSTDEFSNAIDKIGRRVSKPPRTFKMKPVGSLSGDTK